MTKFLYTSTKLTTCAFFLVVCSAYNLFAQAPDGSHCVGQPIGNLLYFDYPANEHFPARTVVYGIGAAPVSSFGPRGSVNYKLNMDSPYPIENMYMISDSLVLTLNGITEIHWGGDPDFPVPAFYGTAVRYEGPTEVESSIYVNPTIDGGVAVIKTCQISVLGKYSVFETVGDNIYGLRTGGGNYGHGVFFSINENGSDYTELYHFHSESERPEKLMLRYEFNNDGTPDKDKPIEFWGISYAGGSHGKGALMVLAIDGSSVWTRLDFTGHGGPDNTWGPTDGDGPVAILQDVDTDGYVITRSGGAHNNGAIFMIGMDGNHKVHDFTAQFGTPSGAAVVDRNSKKVFGISGDTPSNDGYIYSFSLLSDFNFNEHLVDFNNSGYKKPISLAPAKGVSVYVTVSENTATGNGSLLSVNQDGSNLTHLEDYSNCFATVTNPSDGATNVPLQPTLRASRTSTWTRFQLSEQPDFSDQLITLSIDQEYEVKLPHPLKPGTLYYARIDQDISFPGPVTTFTTTTNNLITYIKDPLSGKPDIAINPLIKLASIAEATSYSVDVSEQPDFSTVAFTNTSTTPDVRISGPLKYSTVYYARAKSDATPEYSYTTQFTTHAPEKNCFVSSPINGGYAVEVNDLKVTANLVHGATTYTIELSTDPNFNSNSIVKTSALPGQRTIIFTGLAYYTLYYGRVKTNLSPEWGPRHTFRTKTEPSYVIQPSNNKINVAINPVLKVKASAGGYPYTLDISTTADFTSIVKSYEMYSETVEVNNVLQYSTTYYTRVKTRYGNYGPVTTFATQPPELYSFVSNPVNNASNVAYQNLKITANEIIYASYYTIELNTDPNFTGTSIVKTGNIRQRTIIFDLSPATTYYNRTRTDISDWGPVRLFTTASIGAPPVFSDPPVSTFISPNPFHTTFTVSPRGSEDQSTFITLIDLTGRELYKKEIGPDEQVELGEELADGLYILKLKQGSGIQVHRMIKNR